MKELSKTYDPSQVEDKIYGLWTKSGCFNPDNLPNAKKRQPFTITLPPPNVTGTLHMGHAFEDTIQDAIIRYQRMRGKKTLWLPGTDHAAIATQAKFEKEHYKQAGKSRHDYSREEFFQMIQRFALANQKNILEQLKKLGLSLDWSRLAFTLDEPRELAVKTAFKQMYDAGLIYRAHRVVNWDPKGQTTVSDDEIEYAEAKAKLYTFRYSKDFPIPIATTRPETKLGDTAVAVHPNDKRYKEYVGKEYDLKFCGESLRVKIVADKEVDPEFGTGALGVTPAHSIADYELAQRHGLALKQAVNEFGKMTAGGPDLEGKKTAIARAIIVERLRENGLLEKEQDITQNLSTAQRTGGIIEPLPKLQWFVDVNKKFKTQNSKIKNIKPGQETTLKDIMREAVANGRIKIMPKRFEKIYFHWIDNLRDWCISRQIVYGHRIPVWYHPGNQKSKIKNQNCLQPIVNIEKIDTCPHCKAGLKQDPDTLDTWFSSALWTFSALGWPNETSDLKTYHPTSVMMPGYELLFFWVARMVLMSGFLLGDVPFRQVYLHGMVRDKQGRKFSKSLNNGIDPLEITATYGTDALRMALVFGAAPGNDLIFDEQKIKGMGHFANKLWNIARYILSNISESRTINYKLSDLKAITKADEEVISALKLAVAEVTNDLNNHQLHSAAQAIYQFTWHEFADLYIETSKEQLKDTKLKDNTKAILLASLFIILKLLHPFMPFVTEEIWSQLGQKELLMVAEWPK